MPQEQVHATTDIPTNADHIWALLRNFLWDWHPLIVTMQAERTPTGALIRAFTTKGENTTYREQLTYVSDTQRRLAYTHLAGIQGVTTYNADIQVTPNGAGCTVTMTAQLTAPENRAKEIAQGTQAIFQTTLDALATMIEPAKPTLKPTPRKTPTETITLTGAPTLTLDATPPQDGPLCLFLHGIGGARGNWSKQLPTAATHMRAATLDLRGYGHSTLGNEQSDIDAYCTDILRIMQALNADKLVLCGLSYGAWIATSFAMRHPEKLKGLILSGGCTGMSEAPQATRDAFRQSRQAPLDAGQTPADFAPAVVQMLCAPNASRTARADLLKSMSAIPASTYRDALHCFTNPTETFDFSKLTMPVTMITGEHDTLAPPTEISSVAQRIHQATTHSNVRIEVLKGAGHVCNVEDPDAYNALLSDVLQNIPQ